MFKFDKKGIICIDTDMPHFYKNINPTLIARLLAGDLCCGISHVEEIEAPRITNRSCVAIKMISVVASLRGATFLFMARGAYAAPRAIVGLKNSGIASALFFITSTAQASTLIQCPDWKLYVDQPQTVALNRSKPKRSFEDAVAVVRVATQENARTATSRPLKSKTNWNRKLASAKPATCPTYTVKRGDTLASIAKTFLGSYNRYPSLVSANKGKISASSSLKVGTVLTIPCDLQKVAAVTRASAARDLAAKAQPSKSKKGAAPKAAAIKVSPKPATPPKPLPVWTARSGEYLTDVVVRWGKKAGYKVIKTGTGDWKINVHLKEVGSFEDALKQVIKGFSSQGYPPAVRVFSNKVIKIGSIQ